MPRKPFTVLLSRATFDLTDDHLHRPIIIPFNSPFIVAAVLLFGRAVFVCKTGMVRTLVPGRG